MFATIERALDERTIGHNPERLNLMKVCICGINVPRAPKIREQGLG